MTPKCTYVVIFSTKVHILWYHGNNYFLGISALNFSVSRVFSAHNHWTGHNISVVQDKSCFFCAAQFVFAVCIEPYLLHKTNQFGQDGKFVGRRKLEDKMFSSLLQPAEAGKLYFNDLKGSAEKKCDDKSVEKGVDDPFSI